MNYDPRSIGIKVETHMTMKHNPNHREKAKGKNGLRYARKGTIHIIDHRYRHGLLWLPKGRQTGNTQPQVDPSQQTNHTNPANQFMHN